MAETGTIEQRYNEILRNNMEGVAVVNQHLFVKAVGFRKLGDELIGVLITPWFMNLMILPSDPTAWRVSQQGSKTLRQLPSGPYEFIFGWDPELGGYGMCGLFSPMFEFSSQAQAEATAEEVLKALFDGENYAPTDRQRERSALKHALEQNPPAGQQTPSGGEEEPLASNKKPLADRTGLLANQKEPSAEQRGSSQLAPGSVVDSGSTATEVAGQAQQKVGESAQLSRRQFLTGKRSKERVSEHA